MTDTHGGRRGFCWLSQAWYRRADLTAGIMDEITMRLYSTDGSTTGEFSIIWRRRGLSSRGQLWAFQDSWMALDTFGDVMHQLAHRQRDGEPCTPEAVADILIACGVEDLTPRRSEMTGGC
jgi:hypothetical protein